MSNELGAGKAGRAKNAMAVTLKLSILLAVAFVLALALGHNIWAGLFSDSSSIITEFGSMTPLLAISITLDSVQGVLSGTTLQNLNEGQITSSLQFVSIPLLIADEERTCC